MATMMKAAVFVEPGRIVLDDKPIPDVGPLDALIRITTTTICGTDVHILKGEYPVAKGLTIGHEPVGVIEKLGSAVHGYQRGPARDRRRHHALAARATPACAAATPRTVPGTKHGFKADRRLEVRQHDRRLPGRVRAGARRHGQSGAGAGRAHRRAGADVPGHHVDGLLRRRERQHPDRRHRRGLRAGTDRPVRHGRREADGRDHDHRRRRRRRAPGRRAQAWAPTTSSTSRTATRSRRSCELTDGRGVDVAIEALGTQGTFEVGAARPAAGRHAVEPRRLFQRSDASRSTPSPPASATTRSSRRSARAARSACAA